MNRHRKRWKPLSISACMFALLIAGCIPDNQASIAATEGLVSAFIVFVVDFGRQLLAAFLF